MKDTINQAAGTYEEGENRNRHINKGFVILPTQLLADVAARKISVSAYALYAFLLFWQGTNSQAWYGIKRIAQETGFSQSKVKRLFKELKGAGHIRRTKTMSNSHTECLTRVDKSRKVFVGGEQVESRKVFICGEPADVVLLRNAAKNGDSESVRCEERAPIKAEKKLAPIIEDKEKESSENSDSEVQKPDESWKERLGWSESREHIYRWHLGRCNDNPERAKRAFMNEIMWESPETAKLVQAECPEIIEQYFPKRVVENESSEEVPVDERGADKSEYNEPLF